jgi:hypothetical protein
VPVGVSGVTGFGPRHCSYVNVAMSSGTVKKLLVRTVRWRREFGRYETIVFVLDLYTDEDSQEERAKQK